MNRMITLWMVIGLAVACCWVVIGILIGPNYNLGHSTFVAITAPASFLGRKMPLGVIWFVLLNFCLMVAYTRLWALQSI